MISTTVDNALIAYAKTATGLTKIVWGYQNALKETPPYATIEVLSLVDRGGYGKQPNSSNKIILHKELEVRFNVFTADDTHIIKCSGLVDAANNDDTRLAMQIAGVTYLASRSNVTEVTQLEGQGIYKRRAFVDVAFGVIIERTADYEAIEKISGEVFDQEFDISKT